MAKFWCTGCAFVKKSAKFSLPALQMILSFFWCTWSRSQITHVNFLARLICSVFWAMPTAHSLSQKFSVLDCGYPRSVSVWIMLVTAWRTKNAYAYSDSVADATTAGIITLMKQMGASGAALSAQSPRNKIPPALERASDSLRYGKPTSCR